MKKHVARFSRRILSFLLTVFVIVSSLPCFALSSSAEAASATQITSVSAVPKPDGRLVFTVAVDTEAYQLDITVSDAATGSVLGHGYKNENQDYLYTYVNGLDQTTVERNFLITVIEGSQTVDQASIQVTPFYFDSHSSAGNPDGSQSAPYTDLYNQVRPEIIRQFSGTEAPDPADNEYKSLILLCAAGTHTGGSQQLNEINLDEETDYNDNCSMHFLSRLGSNEFMPDRGASASAAEFRLEGQKINGNTISTDSDIFLGFSYAGPSNVSVQNLKLDGYNKGTLFRRYGGSSKKGYTYPLNSNNTVDHVTMTNMGLKIGVKANQPQYGKPTFTESTCGMFHSIYSTENTLTNCIFDNSQIIANDPQVNPTPESGSHHYHGLYSSKLSDSLIANNLFDSIHGDAIRLRDACNRNVIRQNEILNSGKETACSEYVSFNLAEGADIRGAESFSYGNEFYNNVIGKNFYGEGIRYGTGSFPVGDGYSGYTGSYDRGSECFESFGNLYTDPMLPVKQALSEDSTQVTFVVDTQAGPYDELRAQVGGVTITTCTQFTSYWDKGEEYYRWLVTVPAPSSETVYSFQVREYANKDKPAAYLEDTSSFTLRVLGASHTVDSNGKLSFRVVTLPETSYERLYIYKDRTNVGNHKNTASTPVGRDERGNYVWTVTNGNGTPIEFPTEFANYRMDIYNGSEFYRDQDYYFIDPVKPVISVCQQMGPDSQQLTFLMDTIAGDYDQAIATIGSQTVTSTDYTTYEENGQTYYRWKLTVPAPSEETTCSFDVRAANGEFYPAYPVGDTHSLPVRVLSVTPTVSNDKISFRVVSVPDDSYARMVMYQDRTQIGYHTKAASTPISTDENGNYVWNIVTKGTGNYIDDPGQITTYRMDVQQNGAFTREQAFFTYIPEQPIKLVEQVLSPDPENLTYVVETPVDAFDQVAALTEFGTIATSTDRTIITKNGQQLYRWEITGPESRWNYNTRLAVRVAQTQEYITAPLSYTDQILSAAHSIRDGKISFRVTTQASNVITKVGVFQDGQMIGCQDAAATPVTRDKYGNYVWNITADLSGNPINAPADATRYRIDVEVNGAFLQPECYYTADPIKPIQSVRQVLGSDHKNLTFEIESIAGDYDQIIAKFGPEKVAVSGEHTTFVKNGQPYYRWNITVPAPLQETECTFDIRGSETADRPAYEVHDEHSLPIRVLGVRHIIQDGAISFRVVTVSSNRYARMGVFDERGRRLGYQNSHPTTPVIPDEDGFLVWNVITNGAATIPAPAAVTTYQFGPMIDESFVLADVTYTVDPNL